MNQQGQWGNRLFITSKLRYVVSLTLRPFHAGSSAPVQESALQEADEAMNGQAEKHEDYDSGHESIELKQVLLSRSFSFSYSILKGMSNLN